MYLDVYSPDIGGKKPVLVVVHGGGFLFGKIYSRL